MDKWEVGIQQNSGLTLEQCYSFSGLAPRTRFSTCGPAQGPFIQPSWPGFSLIVILAFAHMVWGNDKITFKTETSGRSNFPAKEKLVLDFKSKPQRMPLLPSF